MGLSPTVGDKKTGRINMQTAAKSNLAFTLISSFNPMAGIQSAIGKPEHNQQISQTVIRRINRRQSLNHIAERLIAIADIAYPLRQMETVEQASDILLGLPLPREYKSIASYYKAFCIKRRGQSDEARTIFERVVDEVPFGYKARTILGLGGVAFDRGDFKSAMPLYIEGGRMALRAREFDPLAIFSAQWAIAILKGIDGNHKGALADLEGMFPLARAANSSYPTLYYNLLNSFAVELLESGRIAEAQNVSRIVLASPYAGAYPEYRDTNTEIEMKGRCASRSIVFIKQYNLDAQNVVQMPLAEHPSGDSLDNTLSRCQEPGQVFDLQMWKEKMVKEPNGDDKTNKTPQEMGQDELLYEIINLFTEPDMDVGTRIEMLESIQKIAARRRSKQQDKDSGKNDDQD